MTRTEVISEINTLATELCGATSLKVHDSMSNRWAIHDSSGLLFVFWMSGPPENPCLELPQLIRMHRTMSYRPTKVENLRRVIKERIDTARAHRTAEENYRARQQAEDAAQTEFINAMQAEVRVVDRYAPSAPGRNVKLIGFGLDNGRPTAQFEYRIIPINACGHWRLGFKAEFYASSPKAAVAHVQALDRMLSVLAIEGNRTE